MKGPLLANFASNGPFIARGTRIGTDTERGPPLFLAWCYSTRKRLDGGIYVFTGGFAKVHGRNSGVIEFDGSYRKLQRLSEDLHRRSGA